MADATGDPQVEVAFSLGWPVAELSHVQADPPPGGGSAPLLPQIKDIPFDSRVKMMVAQVRADLEALHLPIAPVRPPVQAGQAAAAGPPFDPFAAIDLGKIQTAASDLTTEARAALEEVHQASLIQLTAKDFRQGKSYTIGVTLAETVLVPYKLALATATDPEERKAVLTKIFEAGRIFGLRSQIKDLKIGYQPYAADAMAATLSDWGSWARNKIAQLPNLSPTEPPWSATANAALYRQGQVWRALLSGERKSTDFLLVAHYVDAVLDLLERYWTFASRLLGGRFARLVIGGVALASVAIVVALTLWKGMSALAPAIAFLGLFGVTGATVSAAIKKAVDQAESYLWDTEMTASLAVAINYLPSPVANPEVARLRVGALTPDAPAALAS